MSTWSPMTSLGPHKQGEKHINLCMTLCCGIGKYLRLWWHIRGSDYLHLGGSGKKLGLEGGARVHKKDGGGRAFHTMGRASAEAWGCNSKAQFGLASLLSFRYQLKCNLLHRAFSDHLLQKNPPFHTWSYFYVYLFVV